MGEEKPSGCAGDGGLEVLGEASASAEPGKGALDDPSARQELEAFDARRPLDDFDRPWAAIVDGGAQLRAPVDTVGEDVAQAGEASAQRAQQRHGTVRILDVGLMDLADQQEALAIGDDMALAAFDALAGIDPTRATAFGGRGTLAVDDAGRGGLVTPDSLAGLHHQPGVEPTPGAVVAPAVEIALHRRTRREVGGQGAPLAAGGQNIKDRIDDQAQIAGARPAEPPRRRQKGFNRGPLTVRRVACVAQALAPILSASGFSPSHVILRRSFATTTESQVTEITQPISGQPLRSRAQRGVSKDEQQ